MNSAPAFAQLRLKYMATINDQALSEDTDPDYELQYVDIGNVDSAGSVHEVVTYRFADAPSRARRRVSNGDVIISTVRTYLQAIAAVERPPENLIVSTGFAVVHPHADNFDTKFCKYALREPSFLAEVIRRSVGVSYPAINASDLGDIAVYLPLIQQQRAIADFLDRETGRIDALVAAKERFLFFLAEKRRALIARAVTRGLNSNVPLRDSGLPWLGQIPAAWVLSRLKFVASVQGGLALGQNYRGLHLNEYPYLRVANVQDGYLNLDDVVTVMVPDGEASSCLLQPGDVLMNEGGDADKLGRGCVWRGEIEPCLHQNHVFAVRPYGLRPEWLDLWTSSDGAKSYFENRAKQSTNLASISARSIKELPILVPPLSEQRAIVAHIAAETAKLDALGAATERNITLLKERRAALIAAAVTGQIDVGAEARTIGP